MKLADQVPNGTFYKVEYLFLEKYNALFWNDLQSTTRTIASFKLLKRGVLSLNSMLVKDTFNIVLKEHVCVEMYIMC